MARFKLLFASIYRQQPHILKKSVQSKVCWASQIISELNKFSEIIQNCNASLLSLLAITITTVCVMILGENNYKKYKDNLGPRLPLASLLVSLVLNLINRLMFALFSLKNQNPDILVLNEYWYLLIRIWYLVWILPVAKWTHRLTASSPYWRPRWSPPPWWTI